MRFKIWINEYSTPGNAVMDNPQSDIVNRARDDHKKGFGAFQTIGDNPISTGKSPTDKYLDPRFKKMKKKMKRN